MFSGYKSVATLIHLLNIIGQEWNETIGNNNFYFVLIQLENITWEFWLLLGYLIVRNERIEIESI